MFFKLSHASFLVDVLITTYLHVCQPCRGYDLGRKLLLYLTNIVCTMFV